MDCRHVRRDHAQAHIKIRMLFQHLPCEVSRSMAHIVGARMGPDDLGLAVVREEAFEPGNVGVQAARVRRHGKPVRGRHVFADQIEVDIDHHIVAGGNIGQQQQQRVIAGHRLIRVALGQRQVEDRHLPKADRASGKNFLGAFLEAPFQPFAGAPVPALRVNHRVQGSAAAHDGEAVGIFPRLAEKILKRER